MSLALPDDAAVLDAAADPGAFVVAALDRAKAWLATASSTDLPDVVENKRRAEAIRCYVAQKELGKDAELAATEIVRRAERRIGQLIREGQEAGAIRSRATSARKQPGDSGLISPTEIVPEHELGGNGGGIYAMTDGVSDEEFEDAIDEAKAEKNLSRANVVRKIKNPSPDPSTDDVMDRLGRTNVAHRTEQIRERAARGMTARQIAGDIGITETTVRDYARRAGVDLADSVVGKTRRHDSTRIVAETVSTLDGAAMGVGLVDFDDLDAEQIDGWVSSLNASMASLAKFHKQLKGINR